MKYGITLAGMGVSFINLPALALQAENAGWDGVFIWDEMFGPDAWVVMTAIAAQTTRIRIGALLTPLSRRRPWKVASETVTLDHISNGRLILAVGLGAVETGFENVGEETDRKLRAQMLDESLDVLDGLWTGESFSYLGNYFQLREVSLGFRPIQRPRIPIWVAGAWPREKSMRRVLRCDGILPEGKRSDGTSFNVSPEDVRAIQDYVQKRRALDSPFDIVIQNESPGDDREQARVLSQPWEEAGTTWWIENPWASKWIANKDADGLQERVLQGPPR
jgi:alkanesulfonate monooxygenase SsuD/methylene tetrahydromethanopterin reductase-like flavin-dependent oxidoreductase (luciferase family)